MKKAHLSNCHSLFACIILIALFLLATIVVIIAGYFYYGWIGTLTALFMSLSISGYFFWNYVKDIQITDRSCDK